MDINSKMFQSSVTLFSRIDPVDIDTLWPDQSWEHVASGCVTSMLQMTMSPQWNVEQREIVLAVPWHHHCLIACLCWESMESVWWRWWPGTPLLMTGCIMLVANGDDLWIGVGDSWWVGHPSKLEVPTPSQPMVREERLDCNVTGR